MLQMSGEFEEVIIFFSYTNAGNVVAKMYF